MGENALPSTDPDVAAARLQREISNGLIRDEIDLRAALDAPEYRRLRTNDAEQARQRLRGIERRSS